MCPYGIDDKLVIGRSVMVRIKKNLYRTSSKNSLVIVRGGFRDDGAGGSRVAAESNVNGGVVIGEIPGCLRSGPLTVVRDETRGHRRGLPTPVMENAVDDRRRCGWADA